MKKITIKKLVKKAKKGEEFVVKGSSSELINLQRQLFSKTKLKWKVCGKEIIHVGDAESFLRIAKEGLGIVKGREEIIKYPVDYQINVSGNRSIQYEEYAPSTHTEYKLIEEPLEKFLLDNSIDKKNDLENGFTKLIEHSGWVNVLYGDDGYVTDSRIYPDRVSALTATIDLNRVDTIKINWIE